MTEAITRGTIARFPIKTYNASRVRVSADLLPVILHTHVNGVKATITGTAVIQLQDEVPANIAGYYEGRIPTASLAIGDQLEVMVQAVIGGFTTEKQYSFSIVEAATNTPFIDA